MNLGYMIIYVKDVTSTASFYEKAFSLSVKFAHESGTYTEMQTGETTLSFVQEEVVKEQGISFRPNTKNDTLAGIEIAFIAEDVEKAFAQAVDAGAIPLAKPTVKPWGQTVSYVRDLNGVLVEICNKIG